MKRHFTLSAFFVVMCQITFCEVRLPQLVRDSMVLQRDVNVKIWGWASAKEKVKISFQNKRYATMADANGNWIIILPPLKAGGPYLMQIDATNHFTLHDILIGDVWLCSGQSNMVHQMELHNIRYAEEIAQADYPEIGHFSVPPISDLRGAHDDLPTGYWKSANPNDVLHFSAVAFFFAKTIYQKYHIPIGLINASVGGSPIEAWISEKGLREFPFVPGYHSKK